MRRLALLFLCLAILAAPGCFSITHTVGKGAQTGMVASETKQWFALWGLLPIGHHDGGKEAGQPTDYTIETEQTVVDVCINIFTGFASFLTRTVTVTK